MTGITTMRNRMRPRSRLGWWSVGIAGLVVFIAPLVSLALGFVIRLFENSYVVSTSDAMFLTVPCVAASAALGMAAVLLRRDHSPAVVLVTAAMTTIMIILWVEEFHIRT